MDNSPRIFERRLKFLPAATRWYVALCPSTRLQGGNEMKTKLLFLTCSMALFAANPFPPDASGLYSPGRGKIRPRMQEFVDHGTAAGFVTLVARHGRVASL